VSTGLDLDGRIRSVRELTRAAAADLRSRALSVDAEPDAMAAHLDSPVFALIRESETPREIVIPGSTRIVRASLLSGDSRKPLPEELVDELLADSPISAVHGLAQTDIVPARINKGEGVRGLADELIRDGRPSRPPLAFAIGDSFSDLSMLEEASAAFGPANSDQAVRAYGARIMTRSRQAGLAQAVSLFLEHGPFGCELCRGPRRSRDASLLMTALSAGGAGRWRKLGIGLRLAILAAR